MKFKFLEKLSGELFCKLFGELWGELCGELTGNMEIPPLGLPEKMTASPQGRLIVTVIVIVLVVVIE